MSSPENTAGRQLDVPMIYQADETSECGIAALAMIYAYHGAAVLYEQLKAELELVPFAGTQTLGLMMPMLATHLQQNGFETRIITANPLIFSFQDHGASQQDVRTALTERMGLEQKKNDAFIINLMLTYMDAGGAIDVAFPGPETLKREIDAGQPLIALGTTAFLNGDRRMNFHFTVPTGYDAENVYVNNPHPEQGALKHNMEAWFYGLAASCFGDADNGSLLLAKPKTLAL